MFNFGGGYRGDSREVTLVVIEKERDGKEISRFEFEIEYKYGSKYAELINRILEHYISKYGIAIGQENVRVYTKTGIFMNRQKDITDMDVGVRDPRLRVEVTICDLQQYAQRSAQSQTYPKISAQNSTSLAPSKRSLTIHCIEQYSDKTERSVELEMTYECTSQVIDVKQTIIKSYFSDYNVSIPPSDITVERKNGNKLENRIWLSDLNNAELFAYIFIPAAYKKLFEPNTMATSLPAPVYNTVNKTDSCTSTKGDYKSNTVLVSDDCRRAEPQREAEPKLIEINELANTDCSITANETVYRSTNSSTTPAMSDNIRKLFTTELKLNEGEVEQLIPQLASMGICSMDSLLDASAEQIAALKLKPITAKKLQKSIDEKRGSNAPAAAPTGTRLSDPVFSEASTYAESRAAKQVKQIAPQIAKVLEGNKKVGGSSKSSDNNEPAVIDEFEPDETVLIGTEKEASLEELVIQKKDCAEKMHMIIALQTSSEPYPIESRLDKARSYLSSRVNRLSRLIQEREAQGREKQAMGTVSTARPIHNDYTITSKRESGTPRKYETSQATSILRSPASKPKRLRIKFANHNSEVTFFYPVEIGEDESRTECKKSADTNLLTSIGSYVVGALNVMGSAMSPFVETPSAVSSEDTWYCGYCKKSTTVNAYNESRCCHYKATFTSASNMARRWKCSYCYNDNDPERMCCTKCTHAMVSSDTWYCGYCNMNTKVTATGKCSTCFQLAIRVSAKPSFASGWKCTYCHNCDNDPANTKCSKCAQVKYVASNAAGNQFTNRSNAHTPSKTKYCGAACCRESKHPIHTNYGRHR